MFDDSLTLKSFLVALRTGKVKEFEEAVLDSLEEEATLDKSYDGWGNTALHEWYRAMLTHLVVDLGGPNVVDAMLGEDTDVDFSSFGESGVN